MSKMRFAHFRHNILPCLRGEAARASSGRGEASEHQTRSERRSRFEEDLDRINYVDVKDVNQKKDTTRQQLDGLINKKGDLAVALFASLLP